MKRENDTFGLRATGTAGKMSMKAFGAVSAIDESKSQERSFIAGRVLVTS